MVGSGDEQVATIGAELRRSGEANLWLDLALALRHADASKEDRRGLFHEMLARPVTGIVEDKLDAWHELGNLLWAGGLYAEARRHFGKGWRSKPKIPTTFDNSHGLRPPRRSPGSRGPRA